MPNAAFNSVGGLPSLQRISRDLASGDGRHVYVLWPAIRQLSTCRARRRPSLNAHPTHRPPRRTAGPPRRNRAPVRRLSSLFRSRRCPVHATGEETLARPLSEYDVAHRKDREPGAGEPNLASSDCGPAGPIALPHLPRRDTSLRPPAPQTHNRRRKAGHNPGRSEVGSSLAGRGPCRRSTASRVARWR